MGITVTVKLDTSRIDAIMEAAPGVENVVVERAAETTKRFAKGVVPVLTGSLRQSIDYYMVAEGFAIVMALMYYALYVEMGTHKMSARPYLIPALEAIPWVSLLRDAFKEVGL